MMLLLSHGANISARNRAGSNALHWCVYAEESEKSSTVLLERGANPNVVNDQKESPLLRAVIFGRESQVKSLLQGGAKANVHAVEGDTPLHQAAANGRVGIIRLLLKAGAAVNALDSKGHTAMDLALNPQVCKNDTACDNATVVLKSHGGITGKE